MNQLLLLRWQNQVFFILLCCSKLSHRVRRVNEWTAVSKYSHSVIVKLYYYLLLSVAQHLLVFCLSVNWCLIKLSVTVAFIPFFILPLIYWRRQSTTASEWRHCCCCCYCRCCCIRDASDVMRCFKRHNSLLPPPHHGFSCFCLLLLLLSPVIVPVSRCRVPSRDIW